jgi:hypothetical protein
VEYRFCAVNEDVENEKRKQPLNCRLEGSDLKREEQSKIFVLQESLLRTTATMKNSRV